MTSLIDRVMPAWDFREHHRRPLDASPEVAFAALPTVDLARSPFVAPLFAIRSLPMRGRRDRPALVAGTLAKFFSAGFVRLLDEPPRGFVLGSIGEFWRSTGSLRPFEPAAFASDREPGCARLALAFEFVERDGGCIATTETRICCNDGAAFRRMLAYWILIRPASGLIRREMLRLLDRDCAAASGARPA